MKKLILIISVLFVSLASFGQRYTVEASSNAGFFQVNGVDYPQGHFSIKYDGEVDVPASRVFTLYNVYDGRQLISSRYFDEVSGVTSWEGLSVLLESLGVLNTNSSPKPFNQLIAEGLVVGYDSEFKFGQNSQVGSTEEVIWDAGGTYNFLTAAETLDIVSSANNDNIAGTGAKIIAVYGLNSDYEETFQVIEMNGTTEVTTDTVFLRVFRAVVLASGTDSPTLDANEGTITITSSVTSVLQAQINPRNGQTLMCIYTVPAGKTAYVTGVSFGVGEGKECSFKGKFRNGVNGAFSVKFALTLFQSSFNGELKTPLMIPEKIDIVITGISETPSGVKADASFGIILKDN